MKDFARRVKVMMYYQDKYESLMNQLNQGFTNETSIKAMEAKKTLLRQRAKTRRMMYEILELAPKEITK